MITLHTDGGARGNPGPAAIGVVISDQSGKVLKTFGEYIGKTTNNVAEYRALLKGLSLADAMGETEASCFLDSELVVLQLKGEYRVKDPDLKVLYDQILSLKKKFGQVRFTHVPRAKNKHADSIVNKVLDSSPV